MSEYVEVPGVVGEEAPSLELFYAHKLGRGITYLAVGRNQHLEGQLIAKSSQPHIMANTPNDHLGRFADADQLENWFAGGRTVHWLLGKNADLAGVIWYGEKPMKIDIPNPPHHTFAIRLYQGYEGTGLARPSMRLSLGKYVANLAVNSGFSGLWLETETTNAAALHNYERFGYEEVARDSHQVTMVLSPEQIATIFASGD
jgi:GNAT superfamily N-acetyltransferase